jgi:hypothetical protein
MSHIEVGSGMWLTLTSINGLALLLAFIIYVGLAFRADPEGTIIDKTTSTGTIQ